MTGGSFIRANALWLREGRTARALRLYRQAQQEDPADPVVAFQYACALWACEQRTEAAAMMAIAEEHREQLSRVGAMLIDQWRDRVRQPPPSTPDDLPLDLLDRDVLEHQPEPERGWRGLAEVAAAREMPGLARWALEQWNGVPLDADDLDDLARIERTAANTEAMLAELRRSDS
ncbi:MAG: tetratricopeptide repeat protein [Jatrophihabitantaceae bacterium]